jgi:lysophospholipase L1-like esterase
MPLLPAARSRSAALCAAAALALVAGSSGLQSADAQPAASAGHGHSSHHHARTHRYLALGDSVAFGYRPPEVTAPADYLDAGNFRGYPEVLARRTRLRVTNASCPGETTSSMLDVTAQSNGCENSVDSPVGYRTAYPLHTAYAGSQVDYAVRFLRQHRRTRLVSIDIGANDLFVCQATTADKCTGTDFAATVGTVRTNLDTILSTLRHRGRYHHRLVVLTYYSLDYGDPVGTAGITALDAAIAAAARANHAVVADGFGAFRRASAASGGDTCAAGLIIKLPDGTCNVHPTRKGHRVLARAVARAAHR